MSREHLNRYKEQGFISPETHREVSSFLYIQEETDCLVRVSRCSVDRDGYAEGRYFGVLQPGEGLFYATTADLEHSIFIRAKTNLLAIRRIFQRT